MSTVDAQAARRALALQMTVGAVVSVTLALVGLALLGYFVAFPERLASPLTLQRNADDIFPNFIAFHLPPVVSGLVVSGLFAAAMSSIDSGVNSITAVVMHDFFDRFGWKPRTDQEHYRCARWLALGIGGVVILLSLAVPYVPGNITAMTNKTANVLTVPIFCLFFFALFVKAASPVGVWIGAFCGVASALLIAFSGPIFGFDAVTGHDPVSFQWIAPISLIANIAAGFVGSTIFRSKATALHVPSNPTLE